VRSARRRNESARETRELPAAPAGNSGSGAGDTQSGMATIAPALAKGEAVEVRPQEHRVVAEKADLRRIDAWRTRRLEFSDTPLLEAVEEFNRYSTMRVVIGTPELESVRVSGVFSIGEPDGFLFSLKEVLQSRCSTHPEKPHWCGRSRSQRPCWALDP